MQIAVFSDIHANEPALVEVLQNAFMRGIEKFWCLGDMIGYYTNPVEPLMFVKRYVDDDDWVMGNHDAMLADLILPQDDLPSHSVEIASKGGQIRVRGKYQSIEDWQRTNGMPIKALELNRKELDRHEESSRFWREAFTLDKMKPRHKHINGRDHIRVHASQNDYIGRYMYPWQCEILLPKEFQALDEKIDGSIYPQTLWFGHTHVPTLVFGRRDTFGRMSCMPVFIEYEKKYMLDDAWALINPGSVGQSRDGDRRASYAILDTDAQSVTFVRVEYPYQDTARRLLENGYPEALVSKLLTAPPVREMPEVWKKHHAGNGRNGE